MSSETRDRFLKLERPREAPAGRVDPLAHDRRFERVGDDGGGHPAANPPPPPALERFREPRERALETEELPKDAQPFTRCAKCGADGSLYASACPHCGAPLDTPEQRAFNEEVWASHRAEEAAEEESLRVRREAGERQAAELAAARRRAAEELSRAERARVEEELEGGGFRLPRLPEGAPAFRFLSRLPEGARLPIAGLALLLPLLLLLLGRGPSRFLGFALLAAGVWALVPGRPRPPPP
ncbi:MAG TPA: zinc ribbon domain-containing protein [Anaeromyxobacteraceae bacterium]|nr:zinc ribbon domain-containing protein [Anaeromyxobacteraceae bacterium]